MEQVFIQPKYRQAVFQAASRTFAPTPAQSRYHAEMIHDIPDRGGVVVPDDKDRTQAWASSTLTYAAWLYSLLAKDQKWQRTHSDLAAQGANLFISTNSARTGWPRQATDGHAPSAP